MSTTESQIEKLIAIAIEEDLGGGDLTTEACIPESKVLEGTLVLKQAGVIAGLPFFKQLFQKINPKIQVTFFVEEGSSHKSGTLLAKVIGPATSILTGERIALNLIQHASGIATITKAYVKKVAGLNCAILDTRKTLPGLRALEKYAVRVGGGFNYRHSLEERCVIKLNHLAYLNATTNDPISFAVNKLKAKHPSVPIEVEVNNFEQVERALKCDVNAIMLRSMTPGKAKACVDYIHQHHKKAFIESSGAITLDTVRAFAETGVDGILIGDITHSVQALHMSFKLSENVSQSHNI